MPYGYFILSRPVDSTLKFKINVLLPSSGRENQLEKRESCSCGAGGEWQCCRPGGRRGTNRVATWLAVRGRMWLARGGEEKSGRTAVARKKDSVK